MRNTIIATSLVLAAAAFAVSANAETTVKGYASVGAAGVNLGGEKFGAIDLSAGADVNKYLAFEADADIGVTDKTYTSGNINVKVKVNYAIGAYVVGKYPVSPNFDLLGRVGYLKAQLKGSAQGASATVDASGPAYGIGFRYFPKGGANGVRADITHYDFNDDGDGEIYQVSYIHRF